MALGFWLEPKVSLGEVGFRTWTHKGLIRISRENRDVGGRGGGGGGVPRLGILIGFLLMRESYYLGVYIRGPLFS